MIKHGKVTDMEITALERIYYLQFLRKGDMSPTQGHMGQYLGWLGGQRGVGKAWAKGSVPRAVGSCSMGCHLLDKK